ncbi:hypothetical protein M378DRAFT_77450 [Amanita muscaria Koide BX008]|uniref:Peptidase A1 domain-containing protein n=1 Tax=Amanita muscaria (strain Koide BX008) TaxID=946122 RepID=A0A0C2TDX0_AMAMK|nr:hypothetical protein M378DRAFT_77450 [Amanita muscaria Koide BX008]
MRGLLTLLEVSALIYPIFSLSPGPRSTLEEVTKKHTRRTENGIHLPILRTRSPHSNWERRGLQANAGLGDYFDVLYNVLVTVGGTALPLVLDTGSSDLWVASQSCTTGCGNNMASLYSLQTFHSSGLSAHLYYGDASSGTYAFGEIGYDTTTLAGLTLPNQYLAAINNTNTSILDTGSSGIFGLGFPINSAIFDALLNASQSSLSRRTVVDEETPQIDINYHRSTFPGLLSHLSSGVNQRPTPTVEQILGYFSTLGPMFSRSVAAGSMAEPMFSVTLQRDTIELGGNVGMLSIGELPPNVKNESLTWVPLRAYTPTQGGLPGPSNSPNEVYPITWEVFLDDVYLDGIKLPRSQLTSPDIQLSALLDTGNSIIRGPSDVVQFITATLGSVFPCDEPHTLSFSIGGHLFPVDPRDFVFSVNDNDVSTCAMNIAPTNTPHTGGFLFSWSLGDPFLKSVLSAYYYGNLTYPSQDNPRIGLLSTVPSDAGERLKTDVRNANQSGHGFPSQAEPAPTGAPRRGSLDSDGVAQATATSSSGQSSGAQLGFASPSVLKWSLVMAILLLS